MKPEDRAPRFERRVSAELRIGGRAHAGTTRNLSIGGVCVEIDRPLEEGALLSLILFVVEDDIEAEGARGLELTGTVRWMAEADRGYAVGIQFGALNPTQTAQLTRALQLTGAT